MGIKDTPIRRKLMRVILLTSGAVILLTASAYFVYEYYTFRQSMVRQLSMIGDILASNSTAALAFDNHEEAFEILSSARVNTHIIAAALYDRDGNLFSSFPDTIPSAMFPGHPAEPGYVSSGEFIEGFQPVIQNNRMLGTLYLKSDMTALADQLMLYALIAISVVALSSLLAYFLSRRLQRQISEPILSLADTARAISERSDYSVRAERHSNDEIGLLTDAFNTMLARIDEQNFALTESEVRIRAVIDSAMSAVIVMDAAGRIVDWNRRSDKMFGWTLDEVRGKELASLIIPERYRAAHRKGLQHYLQTGEAKVFNHLLELSAIRRNGEEFPVELSISVIRNKEAITFCGFITDITARKEAERQIQSFNQELEQKVADRTAELEFANKEMEAFSYSVSHDLRAPLRSVHGYMNIFAEEYASRLDEEGQRLINVVIRNSKMMGQLIDDLLAFSQLGRRELAKGLVSMHSMVTVIWDELIKAEPGREIQLTLHKLPDIMADASTMRQVWTNLLANAIKYTRNRQVATVEVGATQQSGEIIFCVKDNGAGFNMDYYSKLFGVFQRLHAVHEFEGTGVGLAIVQRIIVKHGGRIWAEGHPGEGATFFFSLPAANSRNS